jgi:hypothetical protein
MFVTLFEVLYILNATAGCCAKNIDIHYKIWYFYFGLILDDTTFFFKLQNSKVESEN